MLLDRSIKALKNSSDTATFAKYFETHYASKKEQWAAYYRENASVNTNMYVEAFHRVLKYVYMKGKVNKRLDNCIYVLLKLAIEIRDLSASQKMKREKTQRELELSNNGINLVKNFLIRK